MSDQVNPLVYSIEETQRLLSVSKSTVLRWIKENKLEAVKFGKATRITRTSIERLLEEAPRR